MPPQPQDIADPLLPALSKRPLIISGPCSAETREQVLATAERLAATGSVDLLRAGIWKPRTKAGNFEGVGSVGLEWLREAKVLTGLPVTVEVANPRQLEEALRQEVDVIWIGARTTANPFSVQELADALRGVKIPVLIKNPVNPDLDLWIGALERVSMAGIEQIGLVHRGFSSYSATQYRNPPMWPLAIEMKLRYPHLPMICDPSHICGRRDLLQDICQKAIDLDYDGLMIESHISPDSAWSDAAQQITPEQVGQLLNALTWRSAELPPGEGHRRLEKLRQEINELDEEVVRLLGKRMQLAEFIGGYKKDHNITILQPNRWNEILERALQSGGDLGLSRDFIVRFFEAVHLESINRQKKIMDED